MSNVTPIRPDLAIDAPAATVAHTPREPGAMVARCNCWGSPGVPLAALVRIDADGAVRIYALQCPLCRKRVEVDSGGL